MAQQDEPPPRVLITGADDVLAEGLCAALVGAGRTVRLTHEDLLEWVEEGGPWVQFFESRLQNEAATDVLVNGCSTLVIFPRRGGQDWLDYNTRRLHNLLLAASCVCIVSSHGLQGRAPARPPAGPLASARARVVWLTVVQMAGRAVAQCYSAGRPITNGQPGGRLAAEARAPPRVVLVSTTAVVQPRGDGTVAGPWACHVDVGDNDSAAGAQAAEYLVRDFAEKTELQATILRIAGLGQSNDCSATEAIHAIACAALEHPLPRATCGGAVTDSAGITVVHVHRGPHPEAPRDSAPHTLPPNVLQREAMRPLFTAPNRSLGVEWRRPGL